jgi:hypothetical protein
LYTVQITKIGLGKSTIQEKQSIIPEETLPDRKKPYPSMKTVFTLCLTAALSLTFFSNLSAQKNTVPPATPSALNSPVKIINLTGSMANDKILLNWAVEENQDANQFEVEKSADGNDFVIAALVFGTDKKDTDYYKFYEKAKNAKTYYRVKAILNNGTIAYSPVIAPAAVNQKHE